MRAVTGPGTPVRTGGGDGGAQAVPMSTMVATRAPHLAMGTPAAARGLGRAGKGRNGIVMFRRGRGQPPGPGRATVRGLASATG